MIKIVARQNIALKKYLTNFGYYSVADYEVIVIGTGLEESIVAAAVARNGHSVLHIDTKDYYGEDWASFNFRALQDWITSQSSEAAQKLALESTESNIKFKFIKKDA